MAIVPRIRSLLYGDARRPKSQVVTNDENKKDYWGLNDDGRDYDHLILLGRIYKRGGPVSEAIRTYANLVFSNGFRIEGEDESMNGSVEDALDAIGLEIAGPQAIIDALVYGDAFHELCMGMGSKADSIVAQVPRNPESFRIDADKFGAISSFTQVIDVGFNRKEEIPLSPRTVFHYTVENLGGSPYGLSLIDSALNDIKWDAMISESTAQAIKRHGFPRMQVKVGQPGEDVPTETMNRLDSQFKNLNAKQEFITTADVEILNVDQMGQTNAKLYGEWSTMRLCTSLGIPEELLGLGRGSTEATANVKLRAFYDKISSIQKRFARAYTQQVIDQLTSAPGMCRLVFNEVNPDDQGRIADWISKIVGATPEDRFAIIPRKAAQDMLGIVETDWDEDDWIDSPNEEE